MADQRRRPASKWNGNGNGRIIKCREALQGTLNHRLHKAAELPCRKPKSERRGPKEYRNLKAESIARSFGRTSSGVPLLQVILLLSDSWNRLPRYFVTGLRDNLLAL